MLKSLKTIDVRHEFIEKFKTGGEDDITLINISFDLDDHIFESQKEDVKISDFMLTTISNELLLNITHNLDEPQSFSNNGNLNFHLFVTNGKLHLIVKIWTLDAINQYAFIRNFSRKILDKCYNVISNNNPHVKNGKIMVNVSMLTVHVENFNHIEDHILLQQGAA